MRQYAIAIGLVAGAFASQATAQQIITNPTTTFQGCVDRTVTPWLIGHNRKDGKCSAEMTQDPVSGALALLPGVGIPGANGGTVTSIAAGSGLAGGTITQSGALSVLYGNAANTAAQGNDTRIVGALQGSNNLSDVTSAATARANLAAAARGVNVDITSITGLTTPLSAAQGGTGASGLPIGLVKGNGTALSGATAGADYVAPTGSGAGLTGITAAQVGAAARGLNNDITSITSLTTPLAAAQGGTGATSVTAGLPQFSGPCGTATAGTATFNCNGLLTGAYPWTGMQAMKGVRVFDTSVSSDTPSGIETIVNGTVTQIAANFSDFGQAISASPAGVLRIDTRGGGNPLFTFYCGTGSAPFATSCMTVDATTGAQFSVTATGAVFPRNVGDVFTDVISVRSFAKCDGVADDTTGLQSFFNKVAAVSAQGLIPQGLTCNANRLIAPSNLSVLLNGTLTQIAGNNKDFITTLAGTTNLRFDGTGTINGNRANQAKVLTNPGACLNMYGVTGLYVGPLTITQCPKFPINVWNGSANAEMRGTQMSYSGNSPEFASCTYCWAYNLNSTYIDDYAFSFYQGCLHCGAQGGHFDHSAGGISVLTDSPTAAMSDDVKIVATSASYNGAAGYITWNNGGPTGARHTNIQFIGTKSDHNHQDPNGSQNYGGIWMQACSGCSVTGGGTHHDGFRNSVVTSGIYFDSAVIRPVVTGYEIYDEGQGGGTGVGITVSNDTLQPLIYGNVVWDDQATKTMGFGLNGQCGAGNACMIYGNSLNQSSFNGPADNITYASDAVHYGNAVGGGNRAVASGMTYTGSQPTGSAGSGTTVAFSSYSTDNTGTVTTTASSAVTVTVTFGTSWSRTPDCTFTPYGQATMYLAGISPTVLQINITSGAGGQFAYRCSAP